MADSRYARSFPHREVSYRRHIVLNATTGVIEQTLLYNHLGNLVAVAQQTEHQYYSAIDYSLPHKVDIQLNPDEGPAINFTVEVGFFLINQSSTAPDAADFAPPDSRGMSTVNLVQANSSATLPDATPPNYTPASNVGYSPANQNLPVLTDDASSRTARGTLSNYRNVTR